jgi:hypothetical protein
MRGQAWIALCSWATAAAACQTGELIEPFNELPVADAKLRKDGMLVEQAPDGSLADLIFPFAGVPVAITLDGTSSRDPDGKIAGYRWLSGTRTPDAGLPPPWTPDSGTPVPFLRRPPPEGALTEASPTMMVGAGVWAVSLWVIDERGAWSSPDTIRFIVGDPPAAPRDGGAGDAGMPPEAGVATDAASATDAAPTTDAATITDAATTTDAATSMDAASTTDAAPITDAGTDAGT